MTEENKAADEDVYHFPCEFPIKAMGYFDKHIEKQVCDILAKYVPTIDQCPVKTKPSSHGKYLAVTVTITATSKEQLDNIYRALHEAPDIVMTL
jgi:uncharacterized protein